MASDFPKGTPHRTQSQLPVEPPHGVRRRVVVDPEALSDRVERRATSAHLGRLGGDPLVHRGLGRIPQLKGEDVVEQGSKALRTRQKRKCILFSNLQKRRDGWPKPNPEAPSTTTSRGVN